MLAPCWTSRGVLRVARHSRVTVPGGIRECVIPAIDCSMTCAQMMFACHVPLIEVAAVLAPVLNPHGELRHALTVPAEPVCSARPASTGAP